MIVSFDTGSKEFEELMVPDTLSTFGHCLNVEVYKESICLLKEHWQNPDIELWVLQENFVSKVGYFCYSWNDIYSSTEVLYG